MLPRDFNDIIQELPPKKNCWVLSGCFYNVLCNNFKFNKKYIAKYLVLVSGVATVYIEKVLIIPVDKFIQLNDD